ncbi:LA_0442/LA_0875 N-terminal domain-containing protein, partial [Leptospira borgpetersenii]
MKKIISSSIFVFLISSVSLRSEVLLLKSGKQVVGNIINQDKETVTFKLTDGTTKVFQKSVIRKISFTKIADPIFKKEEISKNKEETQGKKEAAALAEKQKSKKKSFEERKQELINSKRHHLEVSFGFGNG